MNKGDLKEIIRREIISAINEGKKKKKKQFEGISVEESGHVETNEVGNFWIATGPAKGDTNESKGKKKQNYFETDVFNFAEKVKSGQIALENIKGIFRKESGARRLSEKLIQEREAAVLEATNKANDLKSRLEGIKKEVGEFKKTKTETKQAVAALKNSPNPAKNPAEPYVKPAVKSFDQKTNTVKR